MQIRQASKEHLADYHALITQSKSHWNWPPGYLEQALPILLPSETYLAEAKSYELRDGPLVGFGALAGEKTKPVLDHLWIDPAMLGCGYGRHLCEHLIDVAQSLGAPSLLAYPDPPAEAFYKRLGFRRTGNSIASRVPKGPSFREMRKSL